MLIRAVAAIGTVLAFIALPAVAGGAAPRWEISEICSSSDLGAQCPRIESQNRSSLLLRWAAVPLADREACTASIEHSGKPSYKLMLNCIEERQLKALQRSSEPAAQPSNAS